MARKDDERATNGQRSIPENLEQLPGIPLDVFPKPWLMCHDGHENAKHNNPKETMMSAKRQRNRKTNTAKDRLDRILEAIAQEKLDIPTLQERKLDSLDFPEVSVWGLKAALQAAYEAGRKDSK